MEAQIQEDRLPTRQIVARYVLGSCVGGLLCWSGTYWFSVRAYISHYEGVEQTSGMEGIYFIFMFALGLLVFFGPSLGAAQWFALKETLAPTWIVATLLGWLALVFSGIASAQIVGFAACVTLIAPLAGGSCLGWVQWQVLPAETRQRSGPEALIMGNICGLFAATFTAWIASVILDKVAPAGYFADAPYFTNSVLILGSALFVYSSISGLGLAHILNSKAKTVKMTPRRQR